MGESIQDNGKWERSTVTELCIMIKTRNTLGIFATENEKGKELITLVMGGTGKETGLKMFKMGRGNISTNLDKFRKGFGGVVIELTLQLIAETQG